MPEPSLTIHGLLGEEHNAWCNVADGCAIVVCGAPDTSDDHLLDRETGEYYRVEVARCEPAEAPCPAGNVPHICSPNGSITVWARILGDA